MHQAREEFTKAERKIRLDKAMKSRVYSYMKDPVTTNWWTVYYKRLVGKGLQGPATVITTVDKNVIVKHGGKLLMIHPSTILLKENQDQGALGGWEYLRWSEHWWTVPEYTAIQVLCDANLRFHDIVLKWPGSVRDSTIWEYCSLADAMDNYFMRMPTNYKGWLLGDSGYTKRRNMMIPFADPQTPGEVRFNKSHMKCRFASIFALLPLMADPIPQRNSDQWTAWVT